MILTLQENLETISGSVYQFRLLHESDQLVHRLHPSPRITQINIIGITVLITLPYATNLNL